MTATVLVGDCLLLMPTLEAGSIDAIVTDPPYGLKFMGKQWDHGVPSFEFWAAALRVAKPGAHLVAFGGTRTYHRLTCAIEDAGWEIRDCLSWLYGSGFPKSHNISKAIDREAGDERPYVGPPRSKTTGQGNVYGAITRPPVTSAASAAWDGWGTALKPAHEPIVLARKPMAGTVAANVLEHSTGALNINGCRVGCGGQMTAEHVPGNRSRENYRTGVPSNPSTADFGRWPANVVLDEEAAVSLDEQSGTLQSGFMAAGTEREGLGYHGALGATVRNDTRGDSGGASRFFYTAKASRSERNAGLDGFEAKQRDEQREPDLPGGNNPRNRGARAVANHHPVRRARGEPYIRGGPTPSSVRGRFSWRIPSNNTAGSRSAG